jgi:hypothetical protein
MTNIGELPTMLLIFASRPVVSECGQRSFVVTKKRKEKKEKEKRPRGQEAAASKKNKHIASPCKFVCAG